MKKILFSLSILLILVAIFSSSALAQGMMNWGNNSSTVSSAISSTAQDEAKGKQIWEQLQSKQTNCSNLKDDDFEVLGEYFMGQSIGNVERHTAMNQMMKNMMGEQGEEQMHIILGKRASGCDTSAQIPLNEVGFMPMMYLLRQGFGGQEIIGNGWGNMMSWGGFGLGWIFMIVFWILIILGIVALARYLRDAKQNDADKTPLDILKERYARGEIDKKEFEAKKKDLS